MLEKYVRELERVAPRHPETTRARAALASSRPGVWRPVLGAVLILFPGLATFAHAMWRSLRRRVRPTPVIAALAMSVAVSVAPVDVRADEPSPPPSASAPVVAPTRQPGNIGTWPIDEDKPERSVPTEAQRNRDPLAFGYWLQDVTAKGQLAAQRGDHEAAIRYFRALSKAVPDRAIGLTRLCDEYEAEGEREKAADACAIALWKEGVVYRDYEHYIHLVLAKQGPLSPAEIAEGHKIFDHLREDKTLNDGFYDLECQFSSRASDVRGLERCVAVAQAKAPDAPTTLIYEWELAVRKGNIPEARQLLDRMKASGLKPEVVERMNHEMGVMAGKHIALVVYGLLFVACSVAAATAGILLARRRRTKQGPVIGTAASVDVGST